MKSFLFLHGGPGFNSYAERSLFEEHFREAKIRFWNEPSVFRPEGDRFVPERAFHCWVDSVRKQVIECSNDGPVSLICHSFSVHAATRILESCEQLIDRITLINPCFRPFPVFKKILTLALRDFRELDLDKAKVLSRKIELTRTFFDGEMQEAFAIAAEDPNLTSHYWVSPEKMQTYFAIWGRNNQQFDGASFFKVCEGLASEKPDTIQYRLIQKPVLLIFGKSDPIVDPEEQTGPLKKLFPKIKTSVFENSGHFPHIEDTEKFIRVLREF